MDTYINEQFLAAAETYLNNNELYEKKIIALLECFYRITTSLIN